MATRIGEDRIGEIEVASATTLSIAKSLVTTGGQQVVIPDKVIDAATTGLNGLDVGSLANSEIYYIYAVRSGAFRGYVLSLDGESPAGFTVFSRIGQASTNGSGEFAAAAQEFKEDFEIGHIISAMLDEQTFRGIHGPGWVLSRGQSVVGSRYNELTGQTAVPDLRGMALRGKNNGRNDGNEDLAGELALGTYENDSTRIPRDTNLSGTTAGNGQHRHHSGLGTTSGNDALARYGHETGLSSLNTAWDEGANLSGATRAVRTNEVSNHTHTFTVTAGGDNETRMKCMIVNHFIKIN